MQRGQTRFLRAETPFIFKSARLDPGWPHFDALPHRSYVCCARTRDVVSARKAFEESANLERATRGKT